MRWHSNAGLLKVWIGCWLWRHQILTFPITMALIGHSDQKLGSLVGCLTPLHFQLQWLLVVKVIRVRVKSSTVSSLVFCCYSLGRGLIIVYVFRGYSEPRTKHPLGRNPRQSALNPSCRKSPWGCWMECCWVIEYWGWVLGGITRVIWGSSEIHLRVIWELKMMLIKFQFYLSLLDNLD
jgi:hypothetical protein